MHLRNFDEPPPGILEKQIPFLPGKHTGIPHARAARCTSGIAHAGHAVDPERPAIFPGNGQGHNFAIRVCI